MPAWVGRCIELRRAEERQPERWEPGEQNWQRQPESGERAAKYHNITAINSIVGENNTVFKITHVGEMLRLAATACVTLEQSGRGGRGQACQNWKSCQRLRRGNVALVSQGTSAAVRGQPGIGKSVWPTCMFSATANVSGRRLLAGLRPAVRKTYHVTPELQRMAAFAYEDVAQATKLLEGCELAPEIVAALLRGHGPLLVVADDLWSEEA